MCSFMLKVSFWFTLCEIANFKKLKTFKEKKIEETIRVPLLAINYRSQRVSYAEPIKSSISYHVLI